MLTTRLVILLAATGLAGAATAGAPRHHTSWGKAGVTLVQYSADAAACEAAAINLDISNTEAVRTLTVASHELDEAEASAWMEGPASQLGAVGGLSGFGANVGRVYAKYRPDQQFTAIRQLQYHTMVNCLVQHGYVPFELSADQVSHLRKLRKGSFERRAYLHSLATDPAVLSRQTA